MRASSPALLARPCADAAGGSRRTRLARIALLLVSIPSCTIGSHVGRRVAAPVVCPRPTIRFAVLGDMGTGTADQYAVSRLVDAKCGGRCDFALTLGDNIYESGPSSAQDEVFAERFERPYASLDFPFFVTLGNHDYGMWGVAPPSVAERKARYAIDYGRANGKWVLPAQYYAFDVGTSQSPGLARFLGLDTTRIAWHGDEEQQEWVDAQLAAANTLWRIAFGHHTYVSSGRHGNAGEWGRDFVGGDEFREFVEQRLCGKVDVYFSGHDHLLEWTRPRCGTEFVVSGAAGKFDPPEGTSDSLFLTRERGTGFLLVELSAEELRGTFHTTSGQKFTRVVPASSGVAVAALTAR